MEGENKRRSGSFGSQQTAEASNDEAKKLSLSEGSIVDKESSPVSPESQESSPAGTLKKPRKFKPRKYLAKKLKLRKSDKGSDDQEQNAAESQSEQESIKTSSSVSSKLSEKLSSPKLQRFNFVKRFSSGKKSYQVSPISDDGGEEPKMSLKSLSISDVSVQGENDTPSFISQVDVPLIPKNEEPVILESKKAELKITMVKFEKRATSPSAFERTTQVDKASVEQLRDIELPSQARDQFYAKAPYVEQQTKPINEGETFAAVVREGKLVKSTQSESASEVEKYSILTSSLQTILNTAQDLEDFSAIREGSKVKEPKFPDLPELKIREEKDQVKDKQEFEIEEEENLKEKSFESSEKSQEFSESFQNFPEITHSQESPNDSQDSPETSQKSSKTYQESPENIIGIEIEKEIRKVTASFNTSTPIRPEVEHESTELEESNIFESDEMKNQKKSKIPIDQKRLSASFDASTSTSTVYTSTVHTQEARSPYHVNLSSSSSEESSRIAELSPGEIKFEVGTPVHNFPSPTGSTNILAPLADSESVNPEDSIDVFHSPKSEQSLQPESISKRKIVPYVPQLTIYTPEEQEILKSNLEANSSNDSFDVSSIQADSSVFPVFDDSVVRKLSHLSCS
jgi:hypothetical protein